MDCFFFNKRNQNYKMIKKIFLAILVSSIMISFLRILSEKKNNKRYWDIAVAGCCILSFIRQE